MLQASKLAYYHITIRPTNGKLISGVRELQEESIDHLFNVYQMKASGVYRELEYFNIVLLSRYSQEVIEYEKRKNIQGQPLKIEPISARKPKRENKEIGPTLLERMRASHKPPPAEGTDPDRA
jgi:hypothetical protein